MDQQTFCRLAARLLRHPTAPYHEHAVRAEVQTICTDHNLECERDPFGNVLVRLQTAPRLRPLILAAHLDHPGFELVRRRSPRRWLARFQGGVPDPYFRPGIRVRLIPGGVPAKLGRRKDKKKRLFELHAVRIPAVPPRFAVWELEGFVLQRGRIHARACDDLIGAACILATLIELKQSRARVHVVGVLSRAEEVGFRGALALAATRVLPKDSLLISLETSREVPGVKIGQGVILRVGDRASVFDSEAGRFLAEVAAGLQAVRKRFQFQRALMSGGTCEGTAYQQFGFRTAAVCVALGNYHNCAPANRIKAEYVSVADACGMVELLVAAARQMPQYARLVDKLPHRLRQLLRQARPRLRETAA
jgi:putative aminopeptidase FrvX